MNRRNEKSEDDFAQILRDGVSSTRSYVVLKQKTRSPVYLCFKPFLVRMNSSVIYVGGKLAIFADQTHEQWATLESRDDKIDALKQAWEQLPQDRVSEQRIGSNAGMYLIAAPDDGVLLKEKFDSQHIIESLMGAIEEGLGVEITERNEVKEFLSWYYLAHLKAMFYEGHEGSALPDRLVGKSSPVMLGAEHSYYHSDSLMKFMEQYHLTQGAHEPAGGEGLDDLE